MPPQHDHPRRKRLRPDSHSESTSYRSHWRAVVTDSAYWFLPLTAAGITSDAVAHCVTLVGLARGSAIEGNPFAIFLSMGKLSVPLATSIIGAAYFLAWVVGQRHTVARSDALVFRAAVIGMTAFFLLDMLNDVAIVL